MQETDERYQLLAGAIDKLKGEPGALMPILQEAQAIFGCVPMKAQQIIADALHTTLSEVYGVVTFYSQFTLESQGKYAISVCMGTACYVRGSQKVLDRVTEELGVPVGGTTKDGVFTVKATRCLGACGLAPVMTVGNDVYGRLTPDDVPGILDKYRTAEAAS